MRPSPNTKHEAPSSASIWMTSESLQRFLLYKPTSTPYWTSCKSPKNTPCTSSLRSVLFTYPAWSIWGLFWNEHKRRWTLSKWLAYEIGQHPPPSREYVHSSGFATTTVPSYRTFQNSPYHSTH